MNAHSGCAGRFESRGRDAAAPAHTGRTLRHPAFACTALLPAATLALVGLLTGGAFADDSVIGFDPAIQNDAVVESIPVGEQPGQDPTQRPGVPMPQSWTEGGYEPAPAVVPAAQCQPWVPKWDVAVDALMLWQGNGQSLPLLLDSQGNTAYNADQLQTQMGAGARVGLVRYLGERYSIEGNYFQARPFDATGNVPAGGGPYSLTNTGDLAFADIESAQITTSSSIQSAELNWRKCECWCPITWLAGFRWVEWNSQATIDYAFENPNPFGSGNVATTIGNNLYGGQLGADMRLWNNGGPWRLNGIGKAGVFYNYASFQRSTAGFTTSGGSPSPLGSVSATADQTAFFGEVGLNSTYWITKWLAWRAGYSVFWLSGVATAPQQFPLNNFGDGTATINTNGSVMLHGVTTGIEARW